jgi:hypothetical protein
LALGNTVTVTAAAGIVLVLVLTAQTTGKQFVSLFMGALTLAGMVGAGVRPLRAAVARRAAAALSTDAEKSATRNCAA